MKKQFSKIVSPVNGSAEYKARSFLQKLLRLPGAKIEREAFLYQQLSSYFPPEQVDLAVRFNPAFAGIPLDKIDQLADSVIQSHMLKAGAKSFVTGVPGGLALFATIPADVANFYYHALILAQELAYLYGWPDLAVSDGADTETETLIFLMLGSMIGVEAANKGLRAFSARFAVEVAKELPKKALTKTAYYPAIKQLLKLVGVKLTKDAFSKGVAHAIPVIGGFANAGLTTITLRWRARRYKKHLRKLEYARPQRHRRLYPEIP